MEVEAEAFCPICGKKCECISFNLKVGRSLLIFRCKFCNITFEGEALRYQIHKKSKKVSFSHIYILENISWTKKGFNPSSR